MCEICAHALNKLTHALFFAQDEKRKTKLRSIMAIDLSQQARADPLFPLLDYLVKSSHRQQKPVENIDGRLSKLDSELSSIRELQSEGVWRKYI